MYISILHIRLYVYVPYLLGANKKMCYEMKNFHICVILQKKISEKIFSFLKLQMSSFSFQAEIANEVNKSQKMVKKILTIYLCVLQVVVQLSEHQAAPLTAPRSRSPSPLLEVPVEAVDISREIRRPPL
jgi:hypothetical protein